MIRPCTRNRKCFRSAGSGTTYDQSWRRDQPPRRHSSAPPEGRATRAIDILLPELPGCCDGPGVAITAPATPPPVPRCRRRSSYAPGPYLSRAISFQSITQASPLAPYFFPLHNFSRTRFFSFSWSDQRFSRFSGMFLFGWMMFLC